MARIAEPHRRETILQAATEVFTEQGFSDTRLSDIAQRAGVSTSTLYLYFSSKEEMVYTIARENLQILLSQLRPILLHLRKKDDITHFVEIVLAFAKEHKDQIIVMNLANGLRPGQGIRTTNTEQINKGIEVLRYLMNEGFLRSYDPELAMETLITTMSWLISRSLITPEDEEENLKHFCVQWLAQALLNVPAENGNQPDSTHDPD